MKKSLVAVLAALIITFCVGVAILAVGGAALSNKNSSPVLDAPAPSINSTETRGSVQADQIAQLQSLLAQYQQRETQYQQREEQLQSQLDEANTQLQAAQQTAQQAQTLLEALQQRGLIRVTNDGQIFITQ